MLIAWKQNLKGLSVDEYNYLRRLCKLSKDIYNQSLYNIRQHYFAEGEYLRYEANWHLLKDDDNYKLLGGGIAQQSMKAADQSFKSFFGLLKLTKKSHYESWRIRLPKYLPKDSYHPIVFTDCNKAIKNSKFKVPVSKLLKDEASKLYLTIPKPLKDKNIHQIHIVPKHHGNFFEVRYLFEKEVEPSHSLDHSKALAIDLGVNNFATCATSTGESFIIDGKKIKSINQWYNKENARLSSIKDKQKIKEWTTLQYRKASRRSNQIYNFVCCASKYIVNYCIENNIGNIVVGYNDGFQDNPNLGKVNNQTFVMLPFGKFKSRLEYLCRLAGIHYQTQEESYTSKASFMMNDIIPKWDPRNPTTVEFSGKRISRGLYRNNNNTLINADVNGALNILRKSKLTDLLVLQRRGYVVEPLRVRIS